MKNIKNNTHRFLRFSEKYVKTDMIYLVKGGFWMTTGQIISSGSVLLLSIAFAHLVPKETYGTYKYILSIAGILSAFTLTGFGTAISQSISAGFEQIIKTGFKINMKWSIPFMLISFGVAIYYFINENIILSVSMLIVGIFSPFLSSFNIFSSYLYGKKKFKEVTLYWGAKNILSIASLIAVLFFTDNILIIILTYFVSSILFAAVFYLLTVKKGKERLDNSLELEDKNIINYAKHLSVMNILGTVATHIDKILVFHYLGTVELAIYLFAVSIPEQLKSLLKQISSLALPKFATREIGDIKSGMFSKMLIFGLSILVAIILYIVAAPFIYKIFFPQYLDSIFYSQIFSISLLGIMSVLPTTALQSKADKKSLYKLNIFSSVFQIGAMFVGLYFYGLIGLIVSRIIVRFSVVVVSYFLLIFSKNNTEQ